MSTTLCILPLEGLVQSTTIILVAASDLILLTPTHLAFKLTNKFTLKIEITGLVRRTYSHAVF